MTLPASGPLSLSDIQTEFGGSNPISLNEYYAGGGLVPAGTTGTYGAVPSSGAISVQNFYGTSQFIPVYIENVFSTWLYIGNGSTQTITNGINLSGNGGLVWVKSRSNSYDHALYDTARGINNELYSNATGQAYTGGGTLTAFNSNGFTLGNNSTGNFTNNTDVSWTFQKQPKFFDVVTYTGTGSPRTVSHNLGSVPGCIITKKVNSTSNWAVYHRVLTASGGMYLNLTVGYGADGNLYNNTAPTSSVFTVGGDGSTNASGDTYIAYLFAHDAGGFGVTGTDSVVSCGSYAGDGGAGTTNITIGFEPQWILVKATSGADNWSIFDNLRGLRSDNNASNDASLKPNASNSESLEGAFEPTATGLRTTLFTNYNQSGRTYIYVAIRRGPMKVPTVGTSVYIPDAGTNGTSGGIVPIGFPVDLSMTAYRSLGGVAATNDRVRGYGNSTAGGSTPLMYTSDTTSENDYSGSGPYFYNAWNTTITRGGNGANPGGAGIITWFMGRAPSFMDVVCYIGNGASGRQINHNLGVIPQMIIVRTRNGAGLPWIVWGSPMGTNNALALNETTSPPTYGGFQDQNATSTQFTVSGSNANSSNPSFNSYVAYLFATCPGVSKVGSYTGTGALLTVNCGFTTGARFVLIKRYDSTGAWYVWDSARGISSGNDPYMRLNTNAAEVTGTNYVDTTSVGFQVTAAAPAELNASGGTYLFLAIA